MKRSESLAMLHNWAAHSFLPIRRDSLGGVVPPETYSARDHGMAAVRAIRLLESVPSLFEPAGYLSGATGEEIPREAMNEARLAVRAALRAVGINGAL